MVREIMSLSPTVVPFPQYFVLLLFCPWSYSKFHIGILSKLLSYSKSNTQLNNYFTLANKTEFRITMNKSSEDDEGVGQYAWQLPSFIPPMKQWNTIGQLLPKNNISGKSFKNFDSGGPEAKPLEWIKLTKHPQYIQQRNNSQRW